MLVTLRHSLSDEQCKTINDNYNQHLIKAIAFRDAYNANIEGAEKGWEGKRKTDRDQILCHLESRAQLSPFTSFLTHESDRWMETNFSTNCSTDGVLIRIMGSVSMATCYFALYWLFHLKLYRQFIYCLATYQVMASLLHALLGYANFGS